MTINDWLKSAEEELARAGVGTARLDSLVFAEDTTNRDRGWLLANPEFKLSADQVTQLNKLLRRRARHEPLAFIRGRTEFYGRTFLLNKNVLEPRPESETMIEILKKICTTDPALKSKVNKTHKSHQKRHTGSQSVVIADVGTGSGALGITAALEVPNAQIDLIEVDEKALKVAKMNVDLFTLSLTVIKSDLLANTPQHYDILLCNLPYVPDHYTLNSAAMHEPYIAIFGGPDGLDVYRKLFKQLKNVRHHPLYILTESLPPQHASLSKIAAASGYAQVDAEDFIQIFTISEP